MHGINEAIKPRPGEEKRKEKVETQLRSGVFDERDAREYAPFDDTIGSMKWWACFTEREHEEEFEDDDEFADEPCVPDSSAWERELPPFSVPAPPATVFPD